MFRVLGIVVAIGLAVAMASSAGADHYVEICLRSSEPQACPPKLEFGLDASISPRKLPRHEMVPVALRLSATVSHDDGSQPSALREVVLDVDRDMTLDARGVPACKGGARSVRSAPDKCRDSIVGKGAAHIAIASAPEPTLVPLTLFSGGLKDGRRLIYIYASAGTATFVSTVSINRTGEGLHTVTKIPLIAGGQGSILDFHLSIHRLVGRGDSRASYFEAQCPDGVFKLNLSKILFKNDAQAPGVPRPRTSGGLGRAMPLRFAHFAGRSGRLSL